VLLLRGLAPSDQAGAHAFLERSDPPAQSILPVAPAQVSLWFTENLEPAATSARLLDQRGEDVPGTSFDIGEPNQLIVSLPGGLANGTYSIVWRNISTEDGHPATGYVPFTIGTAADVAEIAAPADAGGSTGAPQWLRAGARWTAFLGLFAALAVWPVWSLILAPVLARDPDLLAPVLPMVGRFALGGLMLSAMGNLAALLVQAADLGGDYGDALRTTLVDTRFGTLMILRFALLIVLALILSFVVWNDPWRRETEATLGIIASLALVAPYSLNAHAAAQPEGRAMAIASDIVHLIGAGLWAGGVALLLAVLLQLWRHGPEHAVRANLASLLPRFSAMAIAAWICLTATGVYAVWLQVGGLDAARETDYGRALLVKLGIAVLLLALGAWHFLVATRRVLRAPPEGERAAGRFRASLGVETGLIVLILLVTGWMTSQPPAREAWATASPANTPSMVVALEANGIAGQLSIAPGTAGPNTIRLTLPTGEAPPGAEALLRLTGPDPGMGEQEILLPPVGDGAWAVTGSHFSVEGSWSVTAIVRKIGEFQWQASRRVAVAPARPASVAPAGETVWRLEDRAIIGLVVLVVGAILTGLLAASRPRGRLFASEA
jgi:copper transport protein